MKTHNKWLKEFITTIILSYLIFSSIGCTTTEQLPGDFVQNTHFNSLQSYQLGSIETTGIDWTDRTKATVTTFSNSTLHQMLQAKGFDSKDSNADFSVRVIWHKRIRLRSEPDHLKVEIEGQPQSIMHTIRPKIMVSVSVELVNIAKETVFWKSELKDTFEILELRDSLVIEVLEKCLKKFPERIQIDPSLKSFR